MLGKAGLVSSGMKYENGRSRCRLKEGPGGLRAPYGGDGDKQRPPEPYDICLEG
jgi:hypothetical protein